MIFRCVLLLLCLLHFSPSYAKVRTAPAPSGPVTPLRFDPDDAFKTPMDPVLAYKAAEDVVLNAVDYTSLPDTVRNDIEGSLGSCSDGTKNLGAIKAYSYVSAMLRSKGMSPNYLVDFSEYRDETKQPHCGAATMCKSGSCVLVSYNSTDYGIWQRGKQLPTQGWVLGIVQDPSIPHPLAIFDVSEQCSQKEPTEGDLCHSRYIWMFGGIRSYPVKD